MQFDTNRVGLTCAAALSLVTGCTSGAMPAGAPLIEEEVSFVDEYLDLIDDCLDGYIDCSTEGGDPATCLVLLRECVDAGDPLLDMGVTCPANGPETAPREEEHDAGDEAASEGGPGHTDLPPPPPLSCNAPDEVIDFADLTAGEILTDQLPGITFSCENNARSNPDTCVAFDTSAPTGGDDDLGTPNCDFDDGPGVGNGGSIGTEGENAVPLGMAVVIAENDCDEDEDGLIDDPDDEARGGVIALDFEPARSVRSLTVLDIDRREHAEVRYTTSDGKIRSIRLASLGSNSAQVVSIESADVVHLELRLSNSGALAELTLGPICDPGPEPECRPGLDRPAIGGQIDACIDALGVCVAASADLGECVNEARACVSDTLEGPLLPLCLRELDFCRSSDLPEADCLAIEAVCDALSSR